MLPTPTDRVGVGNYTAASVVTKAVYSETEANTEAVHPKTEAEAARSQNHVSSKFNT